MAVIDVSVAAGGDDGYVSGSSGFDDIGQQVQIGERSLASLSPSSAWFRFTGISGLAGATIVSSYITLRGHTSTIGVPHDNNIYAEDAAAPAAPTDFSDYNGKTVTTASVAWNPTGVTAGSSHQSPSLNSIIQELVDSYDPSAIQILYKYEGVDHDTNEYNAFRTFENTGFEATLHIEYTAASLIERGTRRGTLRGVLRGV